MTTATAATEQPPGVPSASWLARALGFFSGTVGLVVKLVLLAAANALALYAVVVLAADDRWVAPLLVVAATILIDVIYLGPWHAKVPLKFLVPGTIFLIGFQVIPLISNANVAFTNWSTGHNLTQEEAIAAIQENSLTPPADGATYTMTPARDESGNLVLLLVDEATGKAYVGTEDGLKPLASSDATIENGTVTSAEGYETVKGQELFTVGEEAANLLVPTRG